MAASSPLQRRGSTINVLKPVEPIKRRITLEELLSWLADGVPDFVPEDWNAHHFFEYKDVVSVDFADAIADPAYQPLKKTGKAFLPCYSDLKHVNLEDMCSFVEDVGDRFLFCCRRLPNIDLSPLSAIRSIGDAFLFQCAALTQIDLTPLARVQTIGRNFLAGCTGLTNLSLLPLANLTVLPDGFLSGCTNLDSIDFSCMGKVRQIGAAFLAECKSLSSVDVRPMTVVTAVKPFAFLRGCTEILLIQVDDQQAPFLEAVAAAGLSKQRELSKMVTVLRSKSIQVEQALKENTDKMDAALLEAKSYKASSACFQSQLTEKLDENDMLAAQLGTALTRLATLETDLTACRSQLKDKEEEFNRTSLERDALVQKRAESDASFAAYKEETSSKISSLEVERNNLREELGVTRTEKEALAEEGRRLEAHLVQAKFLHRQVGSERDMLNDRLCTTLVDLENTSQSLAKKTEEAAQLTAQLAACQQDLEKERRSLADARARILELEHIEEDFRIASNTINELTIARDKAVKQFEHNKNRLDICWADLENKNALLKKTQEELSFALAEVAASRDKANRAAVELQYTQQDLSITKEEVSAADAELDAKVKELSLTRSRERETAAARQAAEDAKYLLQTRLFPLRKAATFLRDSLKFGEAAALRELSKWPALTPPAHVAPTNASPMSKDKGGRGQAESEEANEQEDEAVGLFQEIEMLILKRAAQGAKESQDFSSHPPVDPGRPFPGSVAPVPAERYSPRAVRAYVISAQDEEGKEGGGESRKVK